MTKRQEHVLLFFSTDAYYLMSSWNLSATPPTTNSGPSVYQSTASAQLRQMSLTNQQPSPSVSAYMS